MQFFLYRYFVSFSLFYFVSGKLETLRRTDQFPLSEGPKHIFPQTYLKLLLGDIQPVS